MRTKVDKIAVGEGNFDPKLKSALIIYSGSNEPPHFQKCVEEKLTSFVKNDLTLGCQSNPIFFSKLDRIDCYKMKDAKLFKKYDIIFTTLFATNFTKEICLMLKKYLEAKNLTLVFLRGINNIILRELGYLKTDDINPGYGQNFCLNNKVFEELKENSKYLQQFYRKHCFLINEKKDTKNISRINVSDQFIAQIPASDIIKIDDWFTIGLCEGYSEINYSLLLHKKNKVLISHWYGFSHGNVFSHDLLSCLLQYLLFEHLDSKNSKNFMCNLKEKREQTKLIDIEFNLQ